VSQIKRVTVFCGSASGDDPVYAESARALGREMLARDVELVYGGGSIGLMGIVANELLANGGRVTGVIPRTLFVREVGHKGLTTLRIVDTMHERKAIMADLADAFVSLPGGFGTLDETFEALTLVQTRKVTRFPIVLIGREYWSGLLGWLRDVAMADGKLNQTDLDMLDVTDDVDEAVRIMVEARDGSVSAP
jgi:uncharacterized protein (TIGR00730 family)